MLLSRGDGHLPRVAGRHRDNLPPVRVLLHPLQVDAQKRKVSRSERASVTPHPDMLSITNLFCTLAASEKSTGKTRRSSGSRSWSPKPISTARRSRRGPATLTFWHKSSGSRSRSGRSASAHAQARRKQKRPVSARPKSRKRQKWRGSSKRERSSTLRSSG